MSLMNVLKTLPCGALFRAYFCIYILTANAVGALEPQSMINKLTVAAGTLGWTVLFCMSFLALLGLIDTIINDFLPDRYVLYFGLDIRHLILMGLTLCYGMQMWFSVAIHAYWCLLLFSVQVLFLCIAAFMDVDHRYKPPISKKAPHA